MTFNKAIIQTLRADIDAAVAAVAAKHGVRIEAGRAKYSASSAVIQIEVSSVGADGIIHTKGRDDFMLYAPAYGFSECDFGRSFVAGGRVFTISGWNPRSPVRPIEARGDDGKMYKLLPAKVRQYLDRAPQ